MGSFSWLFADTNNTKNLRADRRGYVACPDGTFICEPSYETYGVFDGKDVYDLVVDWNREFIAENPDHLLPHVHCWTKDGALVRTTYRLKDSHGILSSPTCRFPSKTSMMRSLHISRRSLAISSRPTERKSAASALTLRAMTRITPLSPIPSRLPARRPVFAMRNFLRVNGTLNRDSASTVRGMYDGRTS